MFRQKALDRLQSPDQVDQVLTIVHRRNWIPVAILAGLLLVAAVWSIVGTIPITVTGKVILLNRGAVAPFQSSVAGRITKWFVKVGDTVEEGVVLATLAPPDIERQLEEAREKLTELEESNEALAELTSAARALETAAIERKRELLEARIVLLEEQIERNTQLSEAIKARSDSYLEQQRESIIQTREKMKRLGDELAKRVASHEALRRKGLSSEDSLLAIRRTNIENELSLADLELKLQELELSEIRTEETYLKSRQEIADTAGLVTNLAVELRELDIREAEIEKLRREADFLSAREVRDLERRIETLEGQLQNRVEIRAPRGGRIIELTSPVGSVISAGQRLGTLDTEPGSTDLEGLAYFRVKDGKKIEVGDRVRVTPDNVQREREGSIVGEVKSVSPFQVTPEGAANYVGNLEVARALTADEHQIEVWIELEPADTPTGFRWTSRTGPSDVAITAGTTGEADVSIRNRRPISFVIPILREWSGL